MRWGIKWLKNFKDANEPARRSNLKVFYLFTEGRFTEKNYFDRVKEYFQSSDSKFNIKYCCSKNNGAPRNLLKRIKKECPLPTLEKDDEIWLIHDLDQWGMETFQAIEKWSNGDPVHNHSAMSSPKFEYWLLLHFRKAGNITGERCDELLRREIPNFDKNSPLREITREKIIDACKRAAQQYKNNNEDIFNNSGSELFKLIDKFITP